MDTPSNQSRRKLEARSIVAFSALIMVMFCMVVAYQASKAYQAAINFGEAESSRLIQSFSNHINLTFLSVDLTLGRAAERVYFNELFGGTIKQDLENNFHNWVKEAPQISGLYLTDQDGKITTMYSNEGVAIFKIGQSVKDTEFFGMLVEDGNPERQVSLITDNDKSYIVLARKFFSINGEFGGITFSLVDPHYFNDFFRSIETGIGSFMVIMTPEGQVMESGAVNESEEIAVTEDILAREKANPVKGGSFSTRQIAYDGILKIYSYMRMERFPLIMAVSTDERGFLASWRSDRRKDIGFLAMFAVFGSILSYFALTMIRQIKRVEESESAAVLASQAKSEFLANMSHELRTPLNAIIGFSEMLDGGYFGKLTPKQKERVYDIHLCGNHLLQLINDILEFSKCEAGKMELVEEDMDLITTAHECVRMISPRARNKNLTVEVNMPEDLPILHADRRKIRQLLLNLLSNAVKFTEEGGKIEVRAGVNDIGIMEIEVEDSGIGMTEQDITVAMSVFGQAHRSSHPEGTGLGLPLCQMFAELHGGHLSLRSKLGVGTTVIVTMPQNRMRKRDKTANVVSA